MSTVHAPPSASIVFGLANQRLTWADGFGEWIDNSLDADAKTVEIVCGSKSLTIEDDGVGCPDPIVMLQLGEHRMHSTTAQGIFGVGGKDAALWAGGVQSSVIVRSTHKGIQRQAAVSWNDYRKTAEINLLPERAASRDGTEIHIQNMYRTPPTGESWRLLLEKLGYIYTPAIEQGAQIKFKRHTKWEPLLRWTPPPLEGEIIEATLSVAGKSVRVRCGVVQAGARHSRQGFTYYHGRRVINPASHFGCGPYSSARVCGEVWLSGQWPRTKNKDALDHDHKSVVELYEEIARVCEPVLKRAHEAGQELVSESFAAQVNAAVNAMIANAKARRASPRKKGAAHSPTGTGSRHTRAGREQSGETFASGGGGRFRVAYDHQGGTSVGRLSGSDVLLNLDNPAVEALKTAGSVEPIAILACSTIVAQHCSAPTGQFVLKGIAPGATMEDFGDLLGQLLAGGLLMDGKAAIGVVRSEAAD